LQTYFVRYYTSFIVDCGIRVERFEHPERTDPNDDGRTLGGLERAQRWNRWNR
jgi:hypothetical protein